MTKSEYSSELSYSQASLNFFKSPEFAEIQDSIIQLMTHYIKEFIRFTESPYSVFARNTRLTRIKSKISK